MRRASRTVLALCLAISCWSGVAGAQQTRSRSAVPPAGSVPSASADGERYRVATQTATGPDTSGQPSPEKVRIAAAARRADELFAEGTQAFEKGQYPVALQRLEKAYNVYPTYRNAAALGQVELHLGRYRDAAEHLDFSLRTFPGSTDSVNFHRVMDGLSEARRHVHIVNVQSRLKGAQVRVDGQLVGVTPMDHDLFVEPGNRRIAVEADGYDTYLLETFLPAGGQRRVNAELSRSDAWVGGTMRGDSGMDEPPSSGVSTWSPVVLAIGSMTTLATLGTGVALRVGSEQARADAEDERDQLRERGESCLGTRSGECAHLQDTLDRAKLRRDLSSLALMGAAASGALTVVTYSILELTRDEQPGESGAGSRLRVGGGVTGDGPWLNVGGSF